MKQVNILITEALNTSHPQFWGWLCISSGLMMIVGICILCFTSSKEKLSRMPVENEEIFNHLFEKRA